MTHDAKLIQEYIRKLFDTSSDTAARAWRQARNLSNTAK